jgi:hypothetical protein
VSAAWLIEVHSFSAPLSGLPLQKAKRLIGTQYFLAGAIRRQTADDEDDMINQGSWFGCSTVPTPGGLCEVLTGNALNSWSHSDLKYRIHLHLISKRISTHASLSTTCPRMNGSLSCQSSMGQSQPIDSMWEHQSPPAMELILAPFSCLTIRFVMAYPLAIGSVCLSSSPYTTISR